MDLSRVNGPSATTAIVPAVPGIGVALQKRINNNFTGGGSATDIDNVVLAADEKPGGGRSGGDENENSSRVKKVQKFIANVFEITSIHGVAYLTKEGTHAIER